jgi:hypothetical protein
MEAPNPQTCELQLAPLALSVAQEDQLAPFPLGWKALRYSRYGRTSSRRTLAAVAALHQDRREMIQPPDRELQLAPLAHSVLAQS